MFKNGLYSLHHIINVGVFIPVVVLSFFVLTENMAKCNKYTSAQNYTSIAYKQFMLMNCAPIDKGEGQNGRRVFAELLLTWMINIPQIFHLLEWCKYILVLFNDGIRPSGLLHYFCWINRAKISRMGNSHELVRMNQKKPRNIIEICIMARKLYWLWEQLEGILS